METVAEAIPRGARVFEIVGAFFKPKLFGIALSQGMAVGLAGFWILTGEFAFHGIHAMVAQGPHPTVDALDQHLEYNDRRIDDLNGDISKRLDRIEEDRKERRDTSDARFKELAGGLQSVEHDVTFIYGGGIIGTALLSLLLTLNVIKITRADQKLDARPRLAKGLGEEDLEQLAVLVKYLRQPTRERDRDRHWDR